MDRRKAELPILRILRLQNDVIKPINGDPFIGMFETPVTSAPSVSTCWSPRLKISEP